MNLNREVRVKKAAGVLVLDGKCLLVRAIGQKIFVLPGGKLEPRETEPEALKRELREEVSIEFAPEDCEVLGLFTGVAAYGGGGEQEVSMWVGRVRSWRNPIQLAHEIEEAIWVGASLPENLAIGSIFRESIHPMLIDRGLIR